MWSTNSIKKHLQVRICPTELHSQTRIQQWKKCIWPPHAGGWKRLSDEGFNSSWTRRNRGSNIDWTNMEENCLLRATLQKIIRGGGRGGAKNRWKGFTSHTKRRQRLSRTLWFRNLRELNVSCGTEQVSVLLWSVLKTKRYTVQWVRDPKNHVHGLQYYNFRHVFEPPLPGCLFINQS